MAARDSGSQPDGKNYFFWRNENLLIFWVRFRLDLKRYLPSFLISCESENPKSKLWKTQSNLIVLDFRFSLNSGKSVKKCSHDIAANQFFLNCKYPINLWHRKPKILQRNVTALRCIFTQQLPTKLVFEMPRK